MFPLFEELCFFLHGTYWDAKQSVDSLKELITQYGGQIVSQEKDAHLHLVLTMSQSFKEHATHLPFHISPLWIYFCIQKNTLVNVEPFQIQNLPLLNYSTIMLDNSVGKLETDRKKLKELLYLYGATPSQSPSSSSSSFRISKTIFETTILPLISTFETQLQQISTEPFLWKTYPFFGKYFLVQYDMNSDIQHFVNSFVIEGKGALIKDISLLKVIPQEQVYIINHFLPMEKKWEGKFKYRNAQFLEDCLLQKKWITIHWKGNREEFFLYHSLPPLPYEPFLKETVTLTNFRDNERLDLTSLLYFLGANVSPQLYKQHTTILLCNEANNRPSDKIKHSIKWGVPVMKNREWLLTQAAEWFEKFLEQFPACKECIELEE